MIRIAKPTAIALLLLFVCSQKCRGAEETEEVERRLLDYDHLTQEGRRVQSNDYGLAGMPTYAATSSPTNAYKSLSEPGNDESPSSAFPLKRCEGDCDGDSECQPGLVCFFRDGTDPVPGCFGAGYPNTDYCIDKEDDPAKPPVPGAFRVKMYWQRGYDWQETFHEANWCMQCLNSYCYGETITLTPDCLDHTCDISDIMTLRPCSVNNTWFEFTNDYNGTVKSLSQLAAKYVGIKNSRYDKFEVSYKRQLALAYFDFTKAQYEFNGYQEPTNRTPFVVPESLVGGPEAAFDRLVAADYFEAKQAMESIEQIAHLRIVNTNLCLQLMSNNNKRIEVQPCDYQSDRQKFQPGKGNFFGLTFELQTVTVDGCLTQSHHPRDFEMIYREDCELARKYNTSLYNKY